MSASGDVVTKLQQLENSPHTAQRAEAYNSTLSEIIKSFSGSDLATNLVASLLPKFVCEGFLTKRTAPFAIARACSSCCDRSTDTSASSGESTGSLD